MAQPIRVLGEALMDCVAQNDGQLRPHAGGSPYNLARAAALLGADVGYINPLSADHFGDDLAMRLQAAGSALSLPRSRRPTSLAIVQISRGQPSYAFYREGVADRDYDAAQVLDVLRQSARPGVLHTGSLALVPPEHEKVIDVLQAAKEMGWRISVDINLRPKLADDLKQYVAAVRQVIQYADWLKASDEDLTALGVRDVSLARATEIAQQFSTMGAQHIALTFGAQGAFLSVEGCASTRAVPPVDVVDTVGAGDTFWGTCLADWAMQSGNPAERVEHTLQKAVIAAAINCSRAGCQPPSAHELEQALAAFSNPA